MTTDFFAIMQGVRLSKGAHERAGAEMCAMEMVAWLDGEPHSDKPQCACPIIGRFVIGLNDRMRDGERNALLPFLPRIVGTRADRAAELRRAEFLAWKALTVFAPLALDARGYREHAVRLRAIAMPTNRDEWLAARKLAAAAYAADAADAAAAYAADAYAAAAAAADAAYAAYAAVTAARKPVIAAQLAVLDGALGIGPASPGFSRLPEPGAAARVLGMA